MRTVLRALDEAAAWLTDRVRWCYPNPHLPLDGRWTTTGVHCRGRTDPAGFTWQWAHEDGPTHVTVELIEDARCPRPRRRLAPGVRPARRVSCGGVLTGRSRPRARRQGVDAAVWVRPALLEAEEFAPTSAGMPPRWSPAAWGAWRPGGRTRRSGNRGGVDIEEACASRSRARSSARPRPRDTAPEGQSRSPGLCPCSVNLRSRTAGPGGRVVPPGPVSSRPTEGRLA